MIIGSAGLGIRDIKRVDFGINPNMWSDRVQAAEHFSISPPFPTSPPVARALLRFPVY
jgi:hypothetical protein